MTSNDRDRIPRRRAAARFTRAESFDTFGELLTATREMHRLTVEEVGILTNTKAGAIRRFESDRSMPSIVFLRAFRDALGLPLAWLEQSLHAF